MSPKDNSSQLIRKLYSEQPVSPMVQSHIIRSYFNPPPLRTPRLGKPFSLESSTHHRGAGGGGAPNSSPPPMLPPMQELVLGHTLTDLRVQPRNTPGITWTEYHPFSLPARPPQSPDLQQSISGVWGETTSLSRFPAEPITQQPLRRTVPGRSWRGDLKTVTWVFCSCLKTEQTVT